MAPALSRTDGASPARPTLGGVIGFLVFGLVVGVLARLILPGRQHMSLVATLVIGALGSVAGGLVANALGTGDILELNFVGSVVAVVASIAVLAIVEQLGILRPNGREGRDRRR